MEETQGPWREYEQPERATSKPLIPTMITSDELDKLRRKYLRMRAEISGLSLKEVSTLFKGPPSTSVLRGGGVRRKADIVLELSKGMGVPSEFSLPSNKPDRTNMGEEERWSQIRQPVYPHTKKRRSSDYMC